MRRFILVTGASSGIGKSACLALEKQGYHVLAGVRKATDVEQLHALGMNKIHPLLLDVTDDQSVREAVNLAEEIIGDDSLVSIINNAGIAVSGAILYVPMEAWREQLDVNVLGVVRTTQLFFPLLAKPIQDGDKHPRRIINIGSVSGLFASPFVGPYAASKYALEAISDSLRRELYMYDIQVVIIEAGNLATPIWEKAKKSPSYSGPEYDAIMAQRNQMVDKQITQSMPLKAMDELILKTIRSKHIKVRYLIRPGKWKFNIMRWLPAKWIDKLIHKALNAKSAQWTH